MSLPLLHFLRLALLRVSPLALIMMLTGCVGDQGGPGAVGGSATPGALSEGLAASGISDWVNDPPPDLSLLVQRQLADYLSRPEPLAFALSEGGRYASYRYCSDPGTCDPATGQDLSLQDCNSYALDGPCRLYARGQQIVWPGQPALDADLGVRPVALRGSLTSGPAQAKGIVYFLPGYDAWSWPTDVTNDLGPPLLTVLNQRGWDVQIVNTPYYNRHPMMLADIAEAIRALAYQGREQGYARVALVGQSRGAWEIMVAANGTLAADAVVLTAPAAHGTESDYDGNVNSFFQRAQREYDIALQGFRPRRAMVVFFAFDLFDPGGRVDRMRQHLGRTLPPSDTHVINRPPRLRGHAGASDPMFARLYGDCIAAFIEAAAGTSVPCEPALAATPVQGPADFTNVVQVQDADLPRLRGERIAARMQGQAWAAEPGPEPGTVYRFYPGGRAEISLAGRYVRGSLIQARWAVQKDELCVLGSPVHTYREFCYRLYEGGADMVLSVRPDGSVVRLRPAAAVAGLPGPLGQEPSPQEPVDLFLGQGDAPSGPAGQEPAVRDDPLQRPAETAADAALDPAVAMSGDPAESLPPLTDGAAADARSLPQAPPVGRPGAQADAPEQPAAPQVLQDQPGDPMPAETGQPSNTAPTDALVWPGLETPADPNPSGGR